MSEQFEQATAAPGEVRQLSAQSVADRVTAIEAAGDADPERSHSDEDRLKDRVLEAIAAGHPDPQALAVAVLRVNDLDLIRWFA